MTSSSRDSKRILIVEDELIVAEDLCDVLQELGYTVVGTAATAEEAVEIAAQHHPDLVLMDIRLPGCMDGIQAAGALRDTYHVPVVFLTANTDAQTLQRVIEADSGGYLAKPYNASSLQATIELAFRRRDSDRSALNAHAHERAVLEQQNSELGELAERFRLESTIDALTGLHNRRQLDSILTVELSRAQRAGQSVGIILLDLDRFKAVNDKFGHVAADEVLRAVAALLRSRLRAYDFACRYGGEEIVVVLPSASLSDTRLVAEQLRSGIEQLIVEHQGKRLDRITASFGVSSFPRHGVEPEQLLMAADSALYVSKSEGRNRVSIAPPALVA